MKRRYVLPVIFMTALAFSRILILFENSKSLWDASVYVNMGKYFYSFGAVGYTEFFRPVLAPLLYGLAWFFGIPSLDAARTIDGSAGIISIFLVSYIAYKLHDEISGLIAGVVLASSMAYLEFCCIGISSNLAVMFALLAFLFFMRHRFFYSGLCASCAFYSRYSFVLIFPIFFFMSLSYDLDYRRILERIRRLDSSILWRFIYGASIPIVIVEAYNTIMYDVPFYGFYWAGKVISVVGESLPDSWHFYILRLAGENLLFLFIIPGIYFAWKSRKSRWVIFVSLIFLAYFSMQAKKEVRYFTDFIPFFAILAGLGFSYTYHCIRSRWRQAVLILLILLSCIPFAYQFRKELNSVPLFDEKTMEMMKNRDGMMLSSSPIIGIYSDVRLEVIDFVRPGLYQFYMVENRMFNQRVRDVPIEEVWINDCELQCFDQTCSDARDDFISDLKQNMRQEFSHFSDGCNHYLFSRYN